MTLYEKVSNLFHVQPTSVSLP